MMNDGTIVELVRSGDIEKFSILVDRYRGALVRLALSRLGRTDWAEDAVQETFLCAFKSLHSYNPKFSFRTWLWTIQLNQCRRHLRKIQRWSTSSSPDPAGDDQLDYVEQLQGRESTPEDHAIAVERLRNIEFALQKLTPPQADAVRLRFFGQLKFQEIANALGCSLSTAKSRVRMGLQAIASQYDQSRESY